MKTSVYIATSIDGFIAGPGDDIAWLHRPEYSIEGEDYGYSRFKSGIDCIVMGRRTLEKVLEFPEWPFAGLRVIAASRSLDSAPSGVSIEMSRESPELLKARLEREGVKHIYLDGGLLIQAWLAASLVTHLTITRVPIILGRGIRLFGELPSEIPLRLLQSRAYPSGLVQDQYEVC